MNRDRKPEDGWISYGIVIQGKLVEFLGQWKLVPEKVEWRKDE